MGEILENLPVWLGMAAFTLACLSYIGWQLLDGPDRRTRIIGGGAMLAWLAVAVVFYAVHGSPGRLDAPLSERLDEIAAARGADDESRRQAATALEAARRDAAARPDDVEARFALARAAAQAGDSATEIAALESVLAMTGNPAIKAMIGEALSREAGGIVTGKALELIDATLEEEPGNWRARYLKGLHLSQTGDDDAALEYWVPLANDAVGSPIYPVVANVISLAAGRLGFDPSALLPEAGAAGGAPDIAAMVSGIETRLLAEDSVTDHEGWAMLIRSRITLGDEVLVHQRIEDLLERLRDPRQDPRLDSRLLVTVTELLLPPDNLPDVIPPVADRILARARELTPDEISVLFFSGLVARSRGDRQGLDEWWGRLVTMLEEDNPLRPLIEDELSRSAR